MKFIHAIYLGKRTKRLESIKRAPFNQWLSTGILALLCILFGILAVEIPLKHLILPIVTQLGWEFPSLPGTYDPKLLILFFGIAFVVGYLVYLLTKRIRYDDVYLGGMRPLEKFRVLGTEFYNEVRNMVPLKGIYNSAEKKRFDIYDLAGGCTFRLARFFKKLHPGQLQLYSLWIIIGVLIFILVLK